MAPLRKDEPSRSPPAAVTTFGAVSWERVNNAVENVRRRLSESEETETFCLLSLDALVRMKLMSFRDRDSVHLRDLIDVGLVGESSLALVPPALRVRLRHLLEHPED